LEAGGLAPGVAVFAPGVISTGDDDAHVTFAPWTLLIFATNGRPDTRGAYDLPGGGRP
jgi:hypothetical protein